MVSAGLRTRKQCWRGMTRGDLCPAALPPFWRAWNRMGWLELSSTRRIRRALRTGRVPPCVVAPAPATSAAAASKWSGTGRESDFGPPQGSRCIRARPRGRVPAALRNRRLLRIIGRGRSLRPPLNPPLRPPFPPPILCAFLCSFSSPSHLSSYPLPHFLRPYCWPFLRPSLYASSLSPSLLLFRTMGELTSI
jgi:hypothetical protein